MTTITVEGAARIASTMKAAARDLGDMSAAGARTSVLIAGAARGRTPRRSGRLSASLTASSSGQTAQVASNRVYAGVIHYGWSARRIAAHPFLTTAADATRPSWEPLYADAVAGAIAQVKGV